MMETSIDEGIETEDDSEDDPSATFAAFQGRHSGQRRHTLAEVTNQLVVVPNIASDMEGKDCKAMYEQSWVFGKLDLLQVPPESF